jgi:hypothetical protein
VPLYNLQAHNVLTNTIVDAGTDAKVGKFTKRGLEMVDVGIWECVEVWAMKGADGVPVALQSESAPGSRIIRKQPSGLRSVSSEEKNATTTPGSSAVSVVSGGAHAPALSDEPLATPTPISAPPPGKRNVFSKLFSSNKTPTPGHVRNSSNSSATTPKASSQPRMLGVPPDSPTKSHHAKRLSANISAFSLKRDRSSSPNPAMLSHTDEQGMLAVPPSQSPRTSMDNGPSREASGSGPGPLVLPATLGIQPTLNSLLPFPFPPGLVTGERSMAEMQRAAGARLPRGPAMYVWIVRKWLKPALLENGGSVFARFGNGGEARGGLSEIEVRVEWKRGKAKKSSKKGGKDKDVSRRSSYSHISGEEEGKAKKRLSMISTSQSSHRGGTTVGGESDDEDDSDPEDSETPWSCVLKVRRPKLKKEKDDGVRLKLGSLSPTPHHPKVVGMLKVPFPLPDVELGPDLALRKREPRIHDPDADESGMSFSGIL